MAASIQPVRPQLLGLVQHTFADQFHVEREIGRGGDARVFLAYDRSSTSGKHAMNRFADVLRRHEITAFYGLTFVLTWTAFIPWYAGNAEDIPWFTFGPFAAALILSASTGGWPTVKRLLAKIVHWRVGMLWYLVALGLPLVIQLVAILINPLFGSPAPMWSNIPPVCDIIPMVLLFVVFSGPLGEEPGYADLPCRACLRYPALTASLVLGVVWAAWHIPFCWSATSPSTERSTRCWRRSCSPGSTRIPASG